MGDYVPEERSIISALKPVFSPSSSSPETPAVQSLIKALGLAEHLEGGYFVQTDRDETTIPSPYPPEPLSARTVNLAGHKDGFDPALRRLSTTIFYYLTPQRPQGSFHRNRSRIIHTLHRGRGRYVLIHPSGRVETFVVGQNVEKGEKLQWVVEGGTYKASFLLPETDGKDSGGLLISEVVVPGFEFDDHEFLSKAGARELLPEKHARELDWLVREDDDDEEDEEGAQDEKTTSLNGVGGNSQHQHQHQHQRL